MLFKVNQTFASARSFSDCTPPALNDKALAMEAPAASGQGACIQSSFGANVTVTHGRLNLVHLGNSRLPPVNKSGFLNPVSDGAFYDDVQDPHGHREPNGCDSKREQKLPLGLDLKLSHQGLIHAAPSKKSNLDASRTRVVKKGCKVSYHGLRMVVVRVSRGYCWSRPLNIFGKPVDDMQQMVLRCALVQVVA